MYVRLAFAVAAFLEPEILIVDEVLAVGDAEFQKKALGKMENISKGEGRTILFVSHNMAAVRNLCSRGIILNNGTVGFNGGVDEAVDYYLETQIKGTSSSFENKSEVIKPLMIKSFKITSEIKTGNSFSFEVEINANQNRTVQFAIAFRTNFSTPVFQIYSGHVGEDFNLKKGNNLIKGQLESLPLSSGVYQLNLWLGYGGVVYDFHSQVLNILVKEGAIRTNGPVSTKNGYPVISDAIWEKI
jgi:lipopolysaccharide transport system ATP-binding protein